MQNTIVVKLQKVAQYRHENLEQTIAEAVKIGLNKLWLDYILGRYLTKKISRRKAIELAGRDAVKSAEYQDKTVHNDLLWGR